MTTVRAIAANSPAGTRKNSLQPMYFCHNKF